MPKKKKAKKVVKKAVRKVAKKTVKKVKKVTKKKVAKKTKKVKKCSVKSTSLKIKKPLNKSQLAGTVAEITCLSKKDANCVLDALYLVVSAHLKKGGPGEFTLPSIAKLRVVKKPATKARRGVNPFTGETMMFKAKPARNMVKVRALKKVKDAAK